MLCSSLVVNKFMHMALPSWHTESKTFIKYFVSFRICPFVSFHWISHLLVCYAIKNPALSSLDRLPATYIVYILLDSKLFDLFQISTNFKLEQNIKSITCSFKQNKWVKSEDIAKMHMIEEHFNCWRQITNMMIQISH